MAQEANYTLFYSSEDGKLYRGSCREEKEALVDVNIGETAELDGYSGDGFTLTLSGFRFETTADIALVVPGGTVLVLGESENLIRVRTDRPEANVAVLYSRGNLTITGEEGTLICDAATTACTWSRGICARFGDLSISGGIIRVTCGACSVRAGAVYAGGRLFGGENQKGAITITGGSISASSLPESIRATERQLTIGAGSMVTNAKEFSGSEEIWHGSCLSQIDTDELVTVSFPSRKRL
jgi:hypothetical protein